MQNPPKEIILAHLLQADVAMKYGATVQQVCTSIGVDENTFNNWKKEHGGAISTIEEGHADTKEEGAQRFWPIEIWYEYREVFKAAMAHTLIFALLLGILAISHVVIDHLSYP